jgi:hypothetical protein
MKLRLSDDLGLKARYGTLIHPVKKSRKEQYAWFQGALDIKYPYNSAAVPNLFLLAYPQAEKKTHVPLSELGRHFYGIFTRNLSVNLKLLIIRRTP